MPKPRASSRPHLVHVDGCKCDMSCQTCGPDNPLAMDARCVAANKVYGDEHGKAKGIK